MAEQLELFEDNPEYESFVEKFEPKKTTDDCYTPENIYNCVAEWVAKEYNVDPETFVRPFWPGGDYERAVYPKDCVVVDNPPFSLRTQIMDFYAERGIKYFLFSPALTLFAGGRTNVSYIAAGCAIVYENGAIVRTSFVTNMDKYLIRSAPDLRAAVDAANKENLKEIKKQVPTYVYPPHVITAAACQYLSTHGVDLRIRAEDAFFVREMDAQKEVKKAIFGGGFILSERAAAERAAAERAAAERERLGIIDAEWKLSEREREIISFLDRGEIPPEELVNRKPTKQIDGQINMFEMEVKT